MCGRPVTGDIPRPYSRSRKEQLPIEEFVARLDKLFAFPEVEAVRWGQNTPSFNDGDPCVFGVGELRVKIAGSDEEGGDYGDGFLDQYSICRHYGTEWDWRNNSGHPIAKVLDGELDYREVSAFEEALNQAFGDPAEVTATREGFEVEYYERDY